MTNFKKRPPITRLTTDVKNKLIVDIRHRYDNKDLIQHIEAKIDRTTMQIKLELLHFFKKIVKQVPRSLYPDQKLAFEELAEHELIEFTEEQEFYDPVKWINAEIEYLFSKKERSSASLEQVVEREDQKTQPEDLMTFDETLTYLKIAKSTLHRAISNGLPRHKLKKKVYISRAELDAYIKNN